VSRDQNEAGVGMFVRPRSASLRVCMVRVGVCVVDVRDGVVWRLMGESEKQGRQIMADEIPPVTQLR
jgi:hypothetical protein